MPPSHLFKELDFRQTPLGDLILRKRTLLSLGNREIHEVLLGDSYLMSSLFTVVEEALSTLGLAAASIAHPGKATLEVVVGGLGLGYTARAALEHDSVASLVVIDYLAPVIEWHEKGLVPLGPGLVADPRCRFMHRDFFEWALSADESAKGLHAVLLDIDHSPANLLHERHGEFYRPEGLRRLAAKLLPGGVFALWSDDAPEAGFMAALGEVFDSCESHVVSFYNPLQDRESASTVYVATKATS